MSEKVPMIYKQIVAVMGGVGSISKDQQNKQQNYKFRGIDDVYNALHPQLKEHGVFSVPEVLLVEDVNVTTKNGAKMIHTKVTVKYTFYAEDGSNVDTTVIGEGMDSGDKSRNKAMTSAYKNAHFQIFCIPTEEQKDSENDSPEIADEPKKDVAYWKAQADKNTNHVKNIKAWYKKHEHEIKSKALSVPNQNEIILYVGEIVKRLEKELADKKAAEGASGGDKIYLTADQICEKISTVKHTADLVKLWCDYEADMHSDRMSELDRQKCVDKKNIKKDELLRVDETPPATDVPEEKTEIEPY